MFTLICTLALVLATTASNVAQGAQWFPPGSFSEDETVDRARADLIAQYLRAAGEDSLYRDFRPGEVYRLVWIPPFEEAIVVEIRRLDGRSMISSAIFPAAYEQQAPMISSQSVDQSQWDELYRALGMGSFWDTLRNRPDEAGTLVVDPSYWLLEGRDGEAYKVVQRSPAVLGQDDEFLTIAGTLLRLAGFDLTELGLEGTGSGPPLRQEGFDDKQLTEVALLRIALDCPRFAGKRVSVVGAVVLGSEDRRICPTREFLQSDPLNCLWIRLAPPFGMAALKMAAEALDDGDYIYLEGDVACSVPDNGGEHGGALEGVGRIISFESGAVIWDAASPRDRESVDR